MGDKDLVESNHTFEEGDSSSHSSDDESIKVIQEYNMNYPRRGHALIFNHKVCCNMPGEREGTDSDVMSLKRCLNKLQFEIDIYNDREYGEIMSILLDEAAADHGDCDCILIVVLTHGSKDGRLTARDRRYSIDELWKPFTAEKCPSLAGKPKIFIVEACKGNCIDSGVPIAVADVGGQFLEDGDKVSMEIPTHADFVLAYSSTEGYVSFRNVCKGSWYIQCLCRELSLRSSREDLLTILTRTAWRVSMKKARFLNGKTVENKKQIPSFTSMLTRKLYFRKKNKRKN